MRSMGPIEIARTSGWRTGVQSCPVKGSGQDLREERPRWRGIDAQWFCCDEEPENISPMGPDKGMKWMPSSTPARREDCAWETPAVQIGCAHAQRSRSPDRDADGVGCARRGFQ